MLLLSEKKILLAISGGIAAYKAPSLVRNLVQHGADVRVIMTPTAKDFVTPLTLATVSKNEVLSSFIAEDADNPKWNDHVALGTWADLMLVAPATSNTLSAMAQAKCNNLLLATYLSARCPVFIAPAMDLDMYAHPANQKNIEQLKQYGNHVLPVGEGFLASGLEGKGRMLEPHEITEKVIAFFNPKTPLYGKTVLITAGPTYEAIDPVRFIGNHSSGKMGFELANQSAQLGAKVILISGPTALKTQHPNIECISVVNSDQMHHAVKEYYDNVDIAIAAAAVADFKPLKSSSQKIKKDVASNHLTLQPTVDILAFMGERKKKQFLVGFALETNNELEHAINKLKRKNLDAIVLNSLNDKGAGFAGNQNKITFIHADQRTISFNLKMKSAVAKDIFDQILTVYA